MKRTTITLPDPLVAALESYRRGQEAQPPVSAVVEAALTEFLNRRGYGERASAGGFAITPAERGSGSPDGSAAHDRYLSEAAATR
jgi:hypothetical protein